MICTGSQAQTVNVFTVRKAGFKNRKTFLRFVYGSFTVRLRFVYGSQKFNQKGNLLGLPGLLWDALLACPCCFRTTCIAALVPYRLLDGCRRDLSRLSSVSGRSTSS